MEEKESQSRVGTLGEHGTGGRKVKRRAWLSNSVSKKGSNVLAWSIGMPHNKCPFASEVCSRNCYAMTGQFTFHEERYAENYEFTFNPEFVETITTEIVQFVEHHPDEQVSVALHEKGEIYSLDYLNKWEEIVSATEDLTNLNFFVYTRAWRSEPFRKALEEMSAKHSNVRVNLSTDSDMTAKFGVPARIGNGLVTWLAETDQDIPPEGVNLVFRNLRVRHDKPMERIGGVLVCPYESKLFIAKNMNGAFALANGKCKPIRCQECRLCIDRSFGEWDAIKGRYVGTPGQEPAQKPAVAPANETECLFGAEDLQMLLLSDLEETSRPTSQEERHRHDKFERSITRYQSRLIETFLDAADNNATISPDTRAQFTNTAVLIYQFANLDAADHGVTISPYTRDRLINTAIFIYQFANKHLVPREPK